MTSEKGNQWRDSYPQPRFTPRLVGPVSITLGPTGFICSDYGLLLHVLLRRLYSFCHRDRWLLGVSY